MLNKMFCKHDYKLIAKRKSNYCIDYITFSDVGDYVDLLYECKKCGKQQIKTLHKNLNYDLKWERVEE